jgi:hypothetical protein
VRRRGEFHQRMVSPQRRQLGYFLAAALNQKRQSDDEQNARHDANDI